MVSHVHITSPLHSCPFFLSVLLHTSFFLYRSINLVVHSCQFICPFVQVPIRSSVHSFPCLFVRSFFVCSFVRLFVHSFSCLFVRSSVRSLVRSLVRSFVHFFSSFPYSFVGSFIHFFARLFEIVFPDTGILW